MNNCHGFIFAYSASPELQSLVQKRCAASLPFCGRYRLIDFALSSMRNAGIHDVGVIMQRDYQSLLDHIGSGKEWDMSRTKGGLTLLPPFGMPGYHTGEYIGTIEALNGVRDYVVDIPEEYIVLMLGGQCANVDLSAALDQHMKSGAEITAICAKEAPFEINDRYVTDENGRVTRLIFAHSDSGEGVPALEAYVINKATLVELMDRCAEEDKLRFHKDAIRMFLAEGRYMDVYMHDGYARTIRTVEGYLAASMDMLKPEIRKQIFTPARPVLTRVREGVSTYYSEDSVSSNSLVADNCIIEGSIENCIIFPGTRIEKGAVLKNCIVMKGGRIGAGSKLDYVIADKGVTFRPGMVLTGNASLPVVVPKNTNI